MERVKKGERYWYLLLYCTGAKVVSAYDNCLYTDEALFESGNYFHTKEEAEAMAKKLCAVLKGADVIKIPKYEDELNAATNVYHQKGYSKGEYCHEQSFAWGFQEGIDWIKSKIIK